MFECSKMEQLRLPVSAHLEAGLRVTNHTEGLVDHVPALGLRARRGRVLVLADEQTLVEECLVGTEEAILLVGWVAHVEDLTIVAHIRVVAIVAALARERLLYVGHHGVDAIGETVGHVVQTGGRLIHGHCFGMSSRFGSGASRGCHLEATSFRLLLLLLAKHFAQEGEDEDEEKRLLSEEHLWLFDLYVC